MMGPARGAHDPAQFERIREERMARRLDEFKQILQITPQQEGALHLLGGIASDDGTLSVAAATGRLDAPEDLADQLAVRLRSPGAGEQRRVVYA